MRNEILEIIFFVSSIFIITISMLVIIGYALNIPVLKSWNFDQEMALPTAILFFVIGIQNLIYLKLHK